MFVVGITQKGKFNTIAFKFSLLTVSKIRFSFPDWSNSGAAVLQIKDSLFLESTSKGFSKLELLMAYR